MASIISVNGKTYTNPEGSSLRFRLALFALVGLGVMICALAVYTVWALVR